jgi:thioredoxin-related protein
VLQVHFTPTIHRLSTKQATPIVRHGRLLILPTQFEAVLDYAAGKLERTQALGDYVRAHAKERASPTLADEPFFMRAPFDLRRKPGGQAPRGDLRDGRLRAVRRAACRSVPPRRGDGAGAPVRRRTLSRPARPRRLRRRTAGATTAGDFARELGVVYTPSVVFFDASGVEVFRIGAYLRPFHFASTFAYVASGAYRNEPSFQRYLQRRADAMRARGEPVELWK